MSAAWWCVSSLYQAAVRAKVTLGFSLIGFPPTAACPPHPPPLAAAGFVPSIILRVVVMVLVQQRWQTLLKLRCHAHGHAPGCRQMDEQGDPVESAWALTDRTVAWQAGLGSVAVAL